MESKKYFLEVNCHSYENEVIEKKILTTFENMRTCAYLKMILFIFPHVFSKWSFELVT